ncbi:MAG: hypothetical protein QOI44_2529, partial [Actinomycetota bacterium]|nr:hypothetical protein [Actinomycetota bacterium]
AMRRANRSGTRLDRLARGRDRYLARPMLVLERLAGAGTDRIDLGASIHPRARYDDALRRNASSGARRSGM